MNILHLKYAVEVAKTKSISKAAQNLYLGQPNLSRAIKELETSLGIDIFVRTMRGIVVTPDGEKFLEYARRIVAQIDELENIYDNGKIRKRFSLYVTKGTCYEDALIRLINSIPREGAVDIVFKEGTNDEVIDAVHSQEVNLGIIKVRTSQADRYYTQLGDKELDYRSMAHYDSCKLLMKKTHSLAQRKIISLEELQAYPEIICENTDRLRKDFATVNLGRYTNNRIYVPSMSVAFEMLESVTGSYMFAGLPNEDILQQKGLVVRDSEMITFEATMEYEDILIWRTGYNLTDIDKRFINMWQ